MRLVVLALALGLSSLSGCDVDLAAREAPDAGGPALSVLWDPRACHGNPRARIEVRLADSAGVIVAGDTACAACRLELTVGHVGWYAVSALAVDQELGGRMLASTTLAIDAPDVSWWLPW